jgi:hypothetical protein
MTLKFVEGLCISNLNLINMYVNIWLFTKILLEWNNKLEHEGKYYMPVIFLDEKFSKGDLVF